QFDNVAFLEEALRVHTHTDASRGTCRDDVARQQRHKTTQVADNKRNLIDQIGGGAVLFDLTIEFQPQPQIVDVAYFIPGSEEGTQRRERITAFSFYPLTAMLQLKFPFTVVVMQAIPGDIIHRIRFLDVACALTD